MDRRDQKLKIGIVGSGSGSNAQSIIDAIEAGRLDAEVVCVLTDVEGARILARAAAHGIPAQFISAAPFKTKLDGEAEQQYIRVLKAHRANCVVLAGFMRIVKPALLAAFDRRVLNIHPALLPAFPGVASWKQALDYGTRVAGCTVHFVDEDTDTGPIIVQRCVPVEPDDTPETLHARIQVEEHKAYPEALRLMASGRLQVVGRRVIIQSSPLPPDP